MRGNTLIPPSILGRFAIFCAIARQIHLILSIAVFSTELRDLDPSHFIIDQLSAGVPLLRCLFRHTSILFYCHFPDKLLAQSAHGALGLIKSLYRIPFNALESWSTSCSDQIVVNSSFTGQTVKRVFPALRQRDLKVIYPCVDTARKGELADQRARSWPDGKIVLLSINRFERKKDAALALRAFAALSESERRNAILVIAGGYDARLADNVSTLKNLQALSDTFRLRHETLQNVTGAPHVDDKTAVVFLPSISDALKQTLLDTATLLVYTPHNEHFGIVPLEAMLNAVPVLAANEGGPVETVIDGKTGWLRNVAEPEAWTKVFRDVLEKSRSEPARLQRMGRAGQSHVRDSFSKTKMAASFEQSLDGLSPSRRRPLVAGGLVPMSILFLIASLVMYILLR